MKKKMKKILSGLICLTLLSCSTFAETKRITEEFLYSIIRQADQSGGILFADLLSEKLIKTAVQDKSDIAPFYDAIYRIYTKANDKEKMVCLAIFNRMVSWNYRVNEVTSILAKHANNTSDPCYVLAIDLFLRNENLSISLLRETKSDIIDTFLKRLIAYYKNPTCDNNGISNEWRRLVDHLVEFQSPILTDQGKAEMASSLCNKFLPRKDLCHIAETLYEEKFFEISKKMYELILEHPIGLGHNGLDLTNTLYRKKFKDAKNFPITDKMFPQYYK